MALPSSKPLLPRSLFGRALTILLVPLVLLQLVVGLVFFQRHYLRDSEQMTRGIAHELAFAVAEAEAAGSPSSRCARGSSGSSSSAPRCSRGSATTSGRR
jgi:two-component system osmolarity sensor histidine kinase EnvZ